MDGKVKTCTIKRKGVGPNYRWYAILTYESEKAVKAKDPQSIVPRHSENKPVGIDMGLRNIVVTSEGKEYPNQRNYIKAEKQISKLQRKMSRYEKGTPERGRYLQRLYHAFERMNNICKGYLYEVVNDLVDNHSIIVMEDLDIGGLADKSRSRGMRKSFRDANWGRFIFILGYKAEEAGVLMVKVDPSYTSQLCSQCGTMVPKDLSVRRHRCPLCGLDVDRD